MIDRLLLSMALVAATSPAHAAWQVAHSRHFVVYSNDEPAVVAAFATKLERFDRAIRLVLQLSDLEVGASGRLTVYVVDSADDVRRITGGSGADIYRSQSPAGAFTFFPRRSANDQLRRTPSPLMVLQHNYTQQILLAGWGDGMIPAWLNEGFADFFATAKVRADGGVILGGLPEYRWDGIDRAASFPSDRLARSGPDYTNAEQFHIFCGRSWLLIDYLTFDPDRAKQLSAYLAAVRAGTPLGQAAAILGTGTGLDLKLNAYGARPSWPSAVLGSDQIVISAITTRALTAGEAALLPVLMRSRSGARAADTLDQARALAAPFATDASAQNALAQAEYDSGNFAQSVAAADRALAADPRLVDAMVVKGRALVAMATRSGTDDPAAWMEARRWFLAANKADPRYFYPVFLFYESFNAARQTPSAAARKALLYAYALNPANVSVRWEATRVLLQDGNVAAARIALDPAAFGKDGGAFAYPAAKVRQALETGSAAAALLALRDISTQRR